MHFEEEKPPRVFPVGISGVELKDCGDLHLEPDEQVTLRTSRGSEYDVCRKSWGFYATPSINGRLRDHGFKSALVRNRGNGGVFLMLVEDGMMDDFQAYLSAEQLEVLSWLDEEHSKD